MSTPLSEKSMVDGRLFTAPQTMHSYGNYVILEMYKYPLCLSLLSSSWPMETLRKTRHDFYITTMARPLCCTCSIALQLLLHCRHCMSVVIISGPIHLLCKLTIRPRNQACSWATVLIPWPSTFAFRLSL